MAILMAIAGNMTSSADLLIHKFIAVPCNIKFYKLMM